MWFETSFNKIPTQFRRLSNYLPHVSLLSIAPGFHQPQLDKRIQSSTLRSHRLILYVANRFGLGASEKLYAELNRRHFTEAGVLNDRKLLTQSLKVLALSDEEHELAVGAGGGGWS